LTTPPETRFVDDQVVVGIINVGVLGGERKLGKSKKKKNKKEDLAAHFRQQ
jgi:hypothetical protein